MLDERLRLRDKSRKELEALACECPPAGQNRRPCPNYLEVIKSEKMYSCSEGYHKQTVCYHICKEKMGQK